MLNPGHKQNTFVIIPAYNEHTVLKDVLQDVYEAGYKTIVIDDGSQPSLKHLVQKGWFIRHAVNLGQGAALQTGIDFALKKNAAYIVSFDADGQHNANDIEKLVEPLLGGFDVSLGSRFLSDQAHIPSKRKRLLRLAKIVNYIFTGLKLTDAHNGLRAFTAEAAAKIRISENRMAHATEIIAQVKKQKLKFMEVPVQVRYTPYSKNKGQNVWSGFRIFIDLLANKIFR